MGKVSIAEQPKFKVFNTPMAKCKDPFKPTYKGAKKISSNDVCTNWRKCLTECDQSDVMAPIHGPVIVAWRDCMDDMLDVYPSIEAWEKEFLLDHMAAEATLGHFSKEILQACEQESPKYIEFVRREILNSQYSRKLTEEEIDAR
jgi:hypothetical protein